MPNLQRRIFSNAASLNITSAVNHVVDASTEGVAWVFQPFNTDPITHIGFRYGARTGTPPTFSGLIESLDGSGLPNGTDVGGGSPTLKTFTPPASTAWDGTWQWIALANSFTPTRGQVLAGVIRYSSGTIDASNNSSFTGRIGQTNTFAGFPYFLTNSGGTWSKQAFPPLFGWRTASGRYGHIAQSAYTTTTANTAGHRSLMKFQLPSGEGASYQVCGFSGSAILGGAGGSYKIVLTDSSGTVLQDATIDNDHDSNIGTRGARAWWFDEATLATLSYGTDYYIGFEVVSGAVGVSGVVLAEAADREAYVGGLNRCLGTSTGGAITDTTTVMPLLEIIIDEISPATGSGGGAIVIGG